MMIIADLHIHSKYSRATSKDMDIEGITESAKIKGIDLVGTGDFTHPEWLDELKTYLKPKSFGTYEHQGINYFLTSEISCIYSQGERVRKIHIMVIAPSFEVVDKINRELKKIGNLKADGRPILGLSAKDLVEIVLGVSEECFIIPAHIWTPWFSLFGSNSGFDDIEECFGDLTKYIYALETGLSSDPEMNWMLSKLDKFTLVSNSDAHSPANLGREVNIFNCEMDYRKIIDVLKNKDKDKFLNTIEFFPQEGKYHYDGHRNCNVSLSPDETKKHKNICPKCGKSLTIGVMNRVYELADRKLGFIPRDAIPFKRLVPLRQIIASSIKRTPASASVARVYDYLVGEFDSEFNVLLNLDRSGLKKVDPEIVEGITRVKEGKIKIIPGYDGVYGKVEIFSDDKKEEKQMSLF
ncbi:endonuclease Q family protein [bacterium]|nr:endonuclease Q family protein [bacterium]